MRMIDALVACVLTTFAVVAVAQVSSQEYDIRLPRMSLADATIHLSLQTGMNVLSFPRTPKEGEMLIGPLHGRYTIETALRLLTSPHGLVFGRRDARTFYVARPGEDSRAVASARDAAADERTHAYAHANPDPAAPPWEESGTAEYSPFWAGHLIDEVIVTGTRVGGPGEGPTPVLTFTRERLNQLGVSTIAEVFNYIPQQPYAYSERHGLHGQYTEVRGLGPDATLVLINGRRASVGAASLAVNAFDLNAIPLSAVERIEVVAASASAVYGPDAMGGAVNIILRKDIREPIVDLRYGGADGGAAERRVSLSAGHAGERFEGSVIVDYFDRAALPGAERDRWRNQDYRRYGAADRRSLNARPGNVRSLTTANLPTLPAPFAAVPDGVSEPSLADFAATAGATNRESLLRFWAAVPATERASAAGYGELHFSTAAAGFAELLYTRREGELTMEPSSLSSTVVPATNAFNPFGQDVAVNYLLTDIGPRRARAEQELIRAVAGVRGQAREWDWELSTVLNDETAKVLSLNTVDPIQLSAALASGDPASALNVFGDGPAGSASMLASLTAPPATVRFAGTTAQASGFVRGPLLKLPTGEATAVLGAEWRHDELRGPVLPELTRTVEGLFSELHVPLISKERAPALLRELSLRLAARVDRYADFDSAINPEYGVVWRPLRDVTVRASYGESFRPPSLYELYAPRLLSLAQYQDVRRNGEIASFTFATGGNPELQPTQGRSLTTTVEYAPLDHDALKLSASYWRTTIEDRAGLLSWTRVLAAEHELSDRVQRAPPSPADVAANRPGVLLLVDGSYGNFGKTETSGVDFEASYSVDTRVGRWTPRLVAVWTDTFDCTDAPERRRFNRVGVASPLGTIPRWRGSASIEWTRGAWRSVVTARYTHSYGDALGFAQTDRTVPAQTLVDAQIALDFDEWATAGFPLGGLTLTVGMHNVFDEAPPFSEVNTVTGYDLSQGDLRQRFGYVNLSKRF